MSKGKEKLTSVSLPESLFDEFRILAIKNKITFQKLVERSIYLYIVNDDYRKQINNCINTVINKDNNNN